MHSVGCQRRTTQDRWCRAPTKLIPSSLPFHHQRSLRPFPHHGMLGGRRRRPPSSSFSFSFISFSSFPVCSPQLAAAVGDTGLAACYAYSYAVGTAIPLPAFHDPLLKPEPVPGNASRLSSRTCGALAPARGCLEASPLKVGGCGPGAALAEVPKLQGDVKVPGNYVFVSHENIFSAGEK